MYAVSYTRRWMRVAAVPLRSQSERHVAKIHLRDPRAYLPNHTRPFVAIDLSQQRPWVC